MILTVEGIFGFGFWGSKMRVDSSHVKQGIGSSAATSQLQPY